MTTKADKLSEPLDDSVKPPEPKLSERSSQAANSQLRSSSLIPDNIPLGVAKRLAVLALIFGLIGGALAGAMVAHYTPLARLSQNTTEQVTLQESSAVINVAKKVAPSVVSITSQSTTTGFFGLSQQQEGAGTGMILTADGLILTNKHVVPDDTSSYSVFTSDGKEYKNAKVVARDSNNDLAFVKINASGLKPVTLGDSGSVVVGQQVVAIGNALGQFQNSVTHGIISGLGRPVTAGDETGISTEQLQNLFQTDAAINPGNSGGPLVDLDGNVIGINTAIAGNAQNIGFAIPINEVKADAASVQASGKIVTPYLGVRYVQITKDFATANNLSVTDGAYISGDAQNPAIVPDSPAAHAGLRSGDIITKVSGQAIDSTHTLTSLIGQHKVGESVALTVLRGNQTITVNVTLAQAPGE